MFSSTRSLFVLAGFIAVITNFSVQAAPLETSLTRRAYAPTCGANTPAYCTDGTNCKCDATGVYVCPGKTPEERKVCVDTHGCKCAAATKSEKDAVSALVSLGGHGAAAHRRAVRPDYQARDMDMSSLTRRAYAPTCGANTPAYCTDGTNCKCDATGVYVCPGKTPEERKVCVDTHGCKCAAATKSEKDAVSALVSLGGHGAAAHRRAVRPNYQARDMDMSSLTRRAYAPTCGANTPAYCTDGTNCKCDATGVYVCPGKTPEERKVCVDTHGCKCAAATKSEKDAVSALVSLGGHGAAAHRRAMRPNYQARDMDMSSLTRRAYAPTCGANTPAYCTDGTNCKCDATGVYVCPGKTPEERKVCVDTHGCKCAAATKSEKDAVSALVSLGGHGAAAAH